MSVDIGAKAPDFTLKDQDFHDVSLHDFENRPVVLVFFPLAFSSVCSDEMSHFSDNLERFENAYSQVLGISVDSPYALRAFAQQYGIEYPLLSDFNKDVSRKYGVLHSELKGLKEVAKRAVFIIDHNGQVRYKWVSEDPSIEPNFEEVLTMAERINARQATT